LVYDVSSEDIKTISLIGHVGNITSLKMKHDILYSTSDANEIFAWTLEDGKGYVVEK
jgi:hypothetical protein